MQKGHAAGDPFPLLSPSPQALVRLQTWASRPQSRCMSGMLAAEQQAPSTFTCLHL